MRIVITDLDGTLLDHHSYSFEPAIPVLQQLNGAGVPVVFCTSKTRAETQYWREQAGVTGPFIVENGGAIIFPDRVITLGTPITKLRAVLREAAEESGCEVRGFGDLTPEAIAALTALNVEQAKLAAQREFDEPFIAGDEARLPALRQAIESRGCKYTRGGRFHHILGGNDKGRAVELLLSEYRRDFGALLSLGLGDAPNDESFLRHCDVRAMLTRGPAEWADVVSRFLSGS